MSHGSKGALGNRSDLSTFACSNLEIIIQGILFARYGIASVMSCISGCIFYNIGASTNSDGTVGRDHFGGLFMITINGMMLTAMV